MLNKEVKLIQSSTSRKNRSGFVFGILLLFILAGCGGGGGGGGSDNNTPTTGTVTGTVSLDAQDKSNVKVVLSGNSLIAYTDKDGDFKMSNVPVGDNQEIVAVKQGYYKVYRKVRVESGKSTKADDIQLSKISDKTSQTGSVKLTVSF